MGMRYGKEDKSSRRACAIHEKKGRDSMSYDGSLTFDTKIDESGFNSGIKNIGSIAAKGLAVISAAVLAATGVITKTVEDSLAVTLRNERKSVVPTIVADAEFRLEYNGMSVSHSAGEYQIADFVLPAGESTITCYGIGNILFRYREGSL